jgi:hypothetical protein
LKREESLFWGLGFWKWSDDYDACKNSCVEELKEKSVGIENG